MKIRLIESKQDIERFVKKFGQERYETFLKCKQKITDPRHKDITWLVANYNVPEMEELIQIYYPMSQRIKDDIERVSKLPEADDIEEFEYKGVKYYKINTPEASVKYGLGVPPKAKWCISGGYYDGCGQDGNTFTGVLAEAKRFYNQYKPSKYSDYYIAFCPDGMKYCICIDSKANTYDIFEAISDKTIGSEIVDKQTGETLFAGRRRDPENPIWKSCPVVKSEPCPDPIFLLSVDEYEEYKGRIPALDHWWWLRSPGYTQTTAAYVSDDGSVGYFGDSVLNYFYCVRPALRISGNGHNIGDTIYFGGFDWVVVDNNLAISKQIIEKSRFDGESNNYQSSEIRKQLLKWYANNIAGCDGQLQTINESLLAPQQHEYVANHTYHTLVPSDEVRYDLYNYDGDKYVEIMSYEQVKANIKKIFRHCIHDILMTIDDWVDAIDYDVWKDWLIGIYEKEANSQEAISEIKSVSEQDGFDTLLDYSDLYCQDKYNVSFATYLSTRIVTGAENINDWINVELFIDNRVDNNSAGWQECIGMVIPEDISDTIDFIKDNYEEDGESCAIVIYDKENPYEFGANYA